MRGGAIQKIRTKWTSTKYKHLPSNELVGEQSATAIRKTFDLVQVRDYNILIVQSISDNNMKEAISYFKSMEKAGVQANHVSYSILMDNLLKNDQTAQALEMYEVMIESGVKPDMHTFNALLARHVINGDRNDCLEALDKLHDKGHSPDSRTANFLMSIILKEGGEDVQKDCEFLIKLSSKLKEYRCAPNTKTCISPHTIFQFIFMTI